jgi:hypothetical protein
LPGGARMYTVRYHRQNTGSFCGQACVQMLIYSFDQRTQIQQIAWKQALSSGTLGWGTYPIELRDRLVDRHWTTNTPPNLTIRLVVCDNFQAICNWIVYTLNMRRPAPLVLAEGGDHWVLISDRILNAVPAVDSPTSAYNIRKFKVRDPAAIMSTPCAHDYFRESTAHSSDPRFDRCGRGFYEIDGCNVDFGTTEWHYLNYVHTWLYPLTTNKIDVADDDWVGKYLAVIATGPADAQEGNGYRFWIW